MHTRENLASDARRLGLAAGDTLLVHSTFKSLGPVEGGAATVRSDHYSHSVAARGKDAAAFVADHLSLEGPPSPWDLALWGCNYGGQSPLMKAYRRPQGKVLMLGTDHLAPPTAT